MVKRKTINTLAGLILSASIGCHSPEKNSNEEIYETSKISQNDSIALEKDTVWEEIEKESEYNPNIYSTTTEENMNWESNESQEKAKDSSRMESNLETKISNQTEEYKGEKMDGEYVYKRIKELKKAKLDYTQILNDYFKTQSEEEMVSRINWEIIKLDERKEKIDSKHFKFLVKNKEKFDAISTPDSVDLEIIDSYYKNIESHFYKNIWGPQKVENIEYYKEWIEKVKKSEFHLSEQILTSAYVDYFWRVQNWEAFSKYSVKLVDEFKIFDRKVKGIYNWPGRIGNIVNFLNEHVKDEKYLKKAEEWSKKYKVK